MKTLVMLQKITLLILMIIVLICGLSGVGYGQAVTGVITECSGKRQIGDIVNVTIRGTLTARRSVTNLQIEGTANGSFVNIGFLGALSAGQSKNFSLSGIIFTQGNSLSCNVEAEWVEVAQPDPPAPDPTPVPQPRDPTPPPSVGGSGVCQVGDVLSPGESCTYPGTDIEFSALPNGSGRFLFFTAGTGINARNITHNGVKYNFAATKRADGKWLIEAVGNQTTPPPQPTPQPTPRPDLVIQSFQLNEVTLDPGERFTLSATVENSGEGRAPSTTLRYYRSTDATISSRDTQVGTDRVSSLGANRTGNESLSLSAPTSPGTYYYGVCVDSVTDESNTDNNCSPGVRVSVVRNSPDLVVQGVRAVPATVAPGEKFRLYATLKNQGTAKSAATKVRYYRSTDNVISTRDRQFRSVNRSALAPNATLRRYLTVTAPTTPGTYYYGACVEGVTNEIDTDNNCSAAVSVTVTAPTVVAEDVNADGTVDVQDLVYVARRYGQTGTNTADVNKDRVVNIDDMILIAAVLDADAAAAPTLNPAALEGLTVADVKVWLSQAHQRDLTDPSVQRGILFLEQLLASMVPKETLLLANYPNPFNPETWIPYQLSKSADVTLTIYAVDGQIVRQLALGHQPAGIYQSRSRAAYWDGKNTSGEPVASGVYFYTFTAGDFTATRKMLIRK